MDKLAALYKYCCTYCVYTQTPALFTSVYFTFFLTFIIHDFVVTASCSADCLQPPQTDLFPVFLRLLQYAQNIASLPAQTRGSVATASVWAPALSLTTTWPALPASTTTTRVAVCQTAPQTHTSSRAGAASPWTCALKCTCPATLTLSSTGENACPTAPLASHAMRLIGKDVPFPSSSGPDDLEMPRQVTLCLCKMLAQLR